MFAPAGDLGPWGEAVRGRGAGGPRAQARRPGLQSPPLRPGRARISRQPRAAPRAERAAGSTRPPCSPRRVRPSPAPSPASNCALTVPAAVSRTLGTSARAAASALGGSGRSPAASHRGPSPLAGGRARPQGRWAGASLHVQASLGAAGGSSLHPGPQDTGTEEVLAGTPLPEAAPAPGPPAPLQGAPPPLGDPSPAAGEAGQRAAGSRAEAPRVPEERGQS